MPKKKITTGAEVLELVHNYSKRKNYSDLDISAPAFRQAINMSINSNSVRWHILDFFIKYCNNTKTMLDVPEVLYNNSAVNDFLRMTTFHVELPENMSKVLIESDTFLENYVSYFIQFKPSVKYLEHLIENNVNVLKKYFKRMIGRVLNNSRISSDTLSEVFHYVLNNYSKNLLVVFASEFIRSETTCSLTIRNVPVEFFRKLYDLCGNRNNKNFFDEDDVNHMILHSIKAAATNNFTTKQFLNTDLFTNGKDIIEKVFSGKNNTYYNISTACATLIDALIAIGIPEEVIIDKIEPSSNLNTFIKREYFSDDLIRKLLTKYKDGSAMNILAEFRPGLFSENFKTYVEDTVQKYLEKFMPKSVKYLTDKGLVTIDTIVNVDPGAVELFLSLKNLDEGK